MLIDNISKVRDYVKHHLTLSTNNEEFLLFEVVVRKKDNPDNIYMKAHRDSVTIKYWVVDTIDKFDRYIDEMVFTSNTTGGRLYMSCNLKSVKKLAEEVIQRGQELCLNMIRHNNPSLKGLSKMSLSCLASAECDVRTKRTYMFDIDTKDETFMLNLKKNLENNSKNPVFVFETLNGYHLVTRKFNYIPYKLDNVDVKTNAMLLVYFNKEEGKKGLLDDLYRLFRKE